MTEYMKIIRSMMISCQKAGKLIEKEIAGEISISERVQLFFHLRMCEACRHYEKQSKLIQKTLDRFHQIPFQKAPDALKKKIRENFR